MREIKFRAFNKVHKVMDYQDSHTVWDCKIMSEPMQFTGLKDKNGKEIYEGDVLRHLEEAYLVDELLPVHRGGHVTNIGYWEGKKYHHRSNPASRHDNVDDWMSFPEDYEVIGNIYENPELLR